MNLLVFYAYATTWSTCTNSNYTAKHRINSPEKQGKGGLKKLFHGKSDIQTRDTNEFILK